MKRRSVLAAAAIAFSVICASPTGAADDEVNLALRYCAEMTGKINTLVDFTNTDCFFGKGKKGMDFIFVSSRPVFSAEQSKMGWLLVVVASFGKTFNANAMKTESVIVSDASMMKQRQAYRIPSPLARELQRLAYNGEIELETMYARLIAAMEPFSIPE